MFDQFKNTFPLDEKRWNDYISFFNRLQVPAKTTLLEEGRSKPSIQGERSLISRHS